MTSVAVVASGNDAHMLSGSLQWLSVWHGMAAAGTCFSPMHCITQQMHEQQMQYGLALAEPRMTKQGLHCTIGG